MAAEPDSDSLLPETETPALNDRLLLRINHEIRTAVNATLGMTELLLESSLTRQQSSRVNEIRRSTDHLLAQTSAILDLARAEAGSPEIAKAPLLPPRNLPPNHRTALHPRQPLRHRAPDQPLHNLPATAIGDPGANHRDPHHRRARRHEPHRRRRNLHQSGKCP